MPDSSQTDHHSDVGACYYWP